VTARLSVLAGLALVLPLAAPAAAAVGPSPRAQYRQALSRLGTARSFRMIERLDIRAGKRRLIRTEIRYRSPNSLQTIITTLLPRPISRYSQTQVGRRECQTPPGVCFTAPRRPDAGRAVRALLGPALAVDYRAGLDRTGHKVIRLSKQTSKNSRYSAQLTINADTGLPLAFTSSVKRNGTPLITQTASFVYTPVTIHLPPKTR
jgi:hypothetical protein